MHEQIHQCSILWDLGGRHKPCEDKMFSHAEPSDFGFERRSQVTIADDQKLCIRRGRNNFRCGLEQEVIALQLEQPGDLADYYAARTQSQTPGQFRVGHGVGKR